MQWEVTGIQGLEAIDAAKHLPVRRAAPITNVIWSRDFPVGPGLANPPCNAGVTGLIPGWGTRIPRCMPQLGPSAAR